MLTTGGGTENHHLNQGEESPTGEKGKFYPALTSQILPDGQLLIQQAGFRT